VSSAPLFSAHSIQQQQQQQPVMAVVLLSSKRRWRLVRMGLSVGAVIALAGLSLYPSSQSIRNMQKLLLLDTATIVRGGPEGETISAVESTTSTTAGVLPLKGGGGDTEAEQLISSSSSTSSRTASRNSSSSTTKQRQEEEQPQQKTKNKQKKRRPPHEPLNIIILYPDDMRHDSLSSVGRWPVFTPRLDRLAENGIRFAHNCVTTSICWVSRASLFTGQYLARHQAPKLYKTGWYEKWNETWPYLLQKQRDYYVGHIGKWQYHRMEFVKSVFNYTRLFEGEHYHQMPNNERVHTTDHARDTTIAFLRDTNRRPDQKFAVTVAFYPPKALGKEPLFNPKPESAYLYHNITIPRPIEDPVIGWSHLNRTVFGNSNYAKKMYEHYWRPGRQSG
jgi:Sulfatase